MTTNERWISLFSTELERRDVPDERIREEVETVRVHLRDGDDDAAEDAFGDPVAYAATLASPGSEDLPSRTTILSLFAAIATFIVFVIASVRWIDGDASASPWSIVGGVGLLIALVTLSVSLTRRAIAAALRDELDLHTEAHWARASTLLLLLPWTFVGFAGLIPALAALL